MDELIYRQAAIDAILKQTVCATKRELVEICDANISDENGWLGGICIALDTIEDLPSAQSEIIRCKECIHHPGELTDCPMCPMSGWGRQDDDFCSRAERREE